VSVREVVNHEQPEGVMRAGLRIVITLMGAGFALQGVAWLVAPERAAAGLGMPVLDGLARSTQIGDFAAFFLTLGVTTLVGGASGRARLLYFPAAILGAAAFGRTIAWAMHGASFAAAFITVEVIGSLVLLAAARQAGRDVTANAGPRTQREPESR
jgi:hypothetical protein